MSLETLSLEAHEGGRRKKNRNMATEIKKNYTEKRIWMVAFEGDLWCFQETEKYFLDVRFMELKL